MSWEKAAVDQRLERIEELIESIEQKLLIGKTALDGTRADELRGDTLDLPAN